MSKHAEEYTGMPQGNRDRMMATNDMWKYPGEQTNGVYAKSMKDMAKDEAVTALDVVKKSGHVVSEVRAEDAEDAKIVDAVKAKKLLEEAEEKKEAKDAALEADGKKAEAAAAAAFV